MYPFVSHRLIRPPHQFILSDYPHPVLFFASLHLFLPCGLARSFTEKLSPWRKKAPRASGCINTPDSSCGNTSKMLSAILPAAITPFTFIGDTITNNRDYCASTHEYMFQVGFQIFTHLVAFVVRHHGPVPAHWKGKFVWSKYGIARFGKPVVPSPEPDWWWSDDKGPPLSLEDWFDRRASTTNLSAVQRDALARLLRDMVAWEPSRRITAEEVDRRLKAPVFTSLE